MGEYQVLDAVAMHLNIDQYYGIEDLRDNIYSIADLLGAGSVYEFCVRRLKNETNDVQLLFHLGPQERADYVPTQHATELYRLVCGEHAPTKNVHLERSVLRILNYLAVVVKRQVLRALQRFTREAVVHLPKQVDELPVVEVVKFWKVLLAYANYLTHRRDGTAGRPMRISFEETPSDGQGASFSIYEESFSDSHIYDDFVEDDVAAAEEAPRQAVPARWGGAGQQYVYQTCNEMLAVLWPNYANCSALGQFNEVIEPLVTLYEKLKYKRVSPNKARFVDCVGILGIKKMISNIL